MVYQEYFPGVRMSQDDLHFLSPIQFDSLLTSPVDFPKMLVSFRVLTMIFPLQGFQEVSTYQYFPSIVRVHLLQFDLIWSHLCPDK